MCVVLCLQQGEHDEDELTMDEDSQSNEEENNETGAASEDGEVGELSASPFYPPFATL